MALAPGSQLGGYEIRRQIGAGGMGVVYLASDLKLGRPVAIKVLSGDFGADHARTRRFEQEARAASALNHPNVCVVHALGETATGQPFIAMEYVEGHTLRHLVQAQPPTLRQALDIAIQMAAGVGAAHAVGIVHRDLKPENVIVRGDGLVKVLDFGLAKLVSSSLSSEAPEATRTIVQTDAGVVMGTFSYMAPEQARGLDVDARADIWALGVVLYELVAGRPPFTGDTRSDVLAAVLEREPVALDRVNPRVPHELQRIVAKALRKDRAQRYQTVTDLRLDLEALRDELQNASTDTSATSPMALAPSTASSATAPPRESSAEYLITGLGRHKAAAAASVIILAAAIVGLMRWGARGRAAETPTAPPASTKPAMPRALTRITFGDGLQTDATFSPDGSFIAYASDRGGHFNIWVQSVAGGDPVQVTRSDAPDTQPDWSPDGSTIVFRSERDGGGIYLAPALGGTERKLTSFGVHPKWLADGTSISFLTGPSLDTGEGPVQVFTVTVDGRGTPEELAAPFLTTGVWRWIEVRPDGRISAAGSCPKFGPGFFTFDRRGEQVVKSKEPRGLSLVDWTGPQRVRFHWNGSGTALYLESSVNFVENLWRVQVNPQTLDWVTAERLTTGAASDVAAAISRDGARMAYTQRSVTTRLWLLPLDAAAGRVLGAGEPVTEAGSVVQSSSLSPDGEQIAYLLLRPGARVPDLHIRRLASGKEDTINTSAMNLTWSADSRLLAFTRIQKDDGALVVHDTSSGKERPLTTFSNTTWLMPTSWTRDGRALVVSKSTVDVVPMWLWPIARAANGPAPAVDSPERVLLEKAGTNFWEGVLSPSGRWLAFVPGVLAEPDRGRLAVVPFDHASTAPWTEISPDSAWLDKPRWSPDGRLLYFIARGPAGFFDLAAIRFDPDRGTPVGAPFMLTHLDSPALMISNDLSHTEIGISAHRAMLTMVTQTGSVWMLDNVDK
jgi:serine/threonine protein kinase/Tol biopolymer transport system component